jgi:hypothetical protein
MCKCANVQIYKCTKCIDMYNNNIIFINKMTLVLFMKLHTYIPKLEKSLKTGTGKY